MSAANSSESRALTLADVAARVGGRCVGDAGCVVAGIAPVDESTPTDLSLLAARRYVRYIPECAGAAYLVSADLEGELPPGAAAVVVDDAYPALRTLLGHFVPPTDSVPSIHPTAVIGTGVVLGSDVTIGPYAVLEDDVHVGDGTHVSAHCVLGRGTEIGAMCRLHPHVVTYMDTALGSGVTVHSGARLGVDGFGYVFVDGEHAKMPQVGRCVIGDGVEIGANSTVDRGSLGDTRVGQGVKLDNLVHVAHNVRIGAHSLLAALVGVAGSTRIGRGVWMGGQSGAINQLEIGDGAQIAVQAGVTRDVPAGETMSGFPARPHREELKRNAGVGRIPRLRARIAALEAEVARLSDAPDGD